MPVSNYTIEHIHAGYAAGDTAEAVVAQVFRRIAEVADPGIFISLAAEKDVLRAAAALGPFDPAAKPLWGVPFAVKDNIDVAGVPTTAACPEFAYVPQQHATVVTRLIDAGALYIGKTNLDQFATGLVGVRTPYPVPRNALDSEIVPGGSSSGSAVAVAQGIVAFALGTDTAGSGRVPAALNGIVGLKPSLGAVSTSGVVPACRTLDCVSVFAQSVGDAWRVLSAAAAPDLSDAYSRDRPVLSGSAVAEAPRVGVPSAHSIRFFGDTIQAEAFRRQVETIRQRGIKVVEIDLSPFYAVADMLYEGAWVAERLAAIEGFMADHPEALHAVTRKIIGGAQSLSAVDAFRGFYRLETLKRAAEAALSGIDYLCVPTIPTFYALAELAADPIGPNSRLGTYTNFVNLLDMCGVAIPLGARADGRPASVTLLARGGEDRAVCELALLLQGGDRMALPGAPVHDRIEIAVVGAHLSGMPLNGELKALGGRFERKARTVPEYRLHALAGTVPPKPGLVRVAPGKGGAIAVEVWSLPPDGFGLFVSRIPEPLGIGTLRLDDGSTPKGFLAEAVAVDGQPDITGFGGWRAYMSRDAVAAAGD